VRVPYRAPPPTLPDPYEAAWVALRWRRRGFWWVLICFSALAMINFFEGRMVVPTHGPGWMEFPLSFTGLAPLAVALVIAAYFYQARLRCPHCAEPFGSAKRCLHCDIPVGTPRSAVTQDRSHSASGE
jgi:hypothetical protein